MVEIIFLVRTHVYMKYPKRSEHVFTVILEMIMKLAVSLDLDVPGMEIMFVQLFNPFIHIRTKFNGIHGVNDLTYLKWFHISKAQNTMYESSQAVISVFCIVIWWHCIYTFHLLSWAALDIFMSFHDACIWLLLVLWEAVDGVWQVMISQDLFIIMNL